MIHWAIDQNKNNNVQFSWNILHCFVFYQLIMLIFTPKITIQNRILPHVIEYVLIPSNKYIFLRPRQIPNLFAYICSKIWNEQRVLLTNSCRTDRGTTLPYLELLSEPKWFETFSNCSATPKMWNFFSRFFNRNLLGPPRVIT